jgi:hypothetical protein
MAEWLSRFFGRSERPGDNVTDDESESTLGRRGAQHSSPTKNPARANRGDNEKTIKIEPSRSSSRLTWPARDEQNAPAPSAQPRYQEPAFDPHEEPTRLVGTRSDRPRTDDANRAPDRFGAATSRLPEDPIMSRRPAGSAPPTTREPTIEEPSDDTTRLVASSDAGQHDDPVVGWLVVIDGPGRGRSMEIGSGANPIGRAPGQKLCLNFGDTRISRERHAVIVYDPLSRRFFLQSGPGRNLTYLGSDVVLEPKEMKPGDTITVGDTVLHFVPYCGADFGWS